MANMTDEQILALAAEICGANVELSASVATMIASAYRKGIEDALTQLGLEPDTLDDDAATAWTL